MAYPDKHKDEILRLGALGYSYNKIREITGASKGTISYHLGPGQREKSNARNRHTKSRRRDKINERKNLPCPDCGRTYHPCQMDFDHKDPSQKLGGINELLKNGTWEEVVAEMDKCEVVCSNCHRLRTWTKGQWRWQGTKK